jgi:Pretoxin HINT domain
MNRNVRSQVRAWRRVGDRRRRRSCTRAASALVTPAVPLETTKEHALFVVDQGFTRAGQLAPGATLTCESGESLQVGTITQNHRENTVYNIEVENFHTYFVGKKSTVGA